EAIDSILQQTFPLIEVIVVDDGSTDDTAQHADEINHARLRYISQAHARASAARNLDARMATGRSLTFLDSDDVWEPEKVAVHLAEFDRQPGLDMVFGYYAEFVSPELVKGQPLLMEHMPGYSSRTMLIRRESFERVGGFSAR